MARNPKNKSQAGNDIPETIRPRPTREIFLLFNRSYGPDREILRGIYEFAYPTHRWLFFFGSQKVETIKTISRAKNIAGVIGKFGRPDLVEAVSKLKIRLFVNSCDESGMAVERWHDI